VYKLKQEEFHLPHFFISSSLAMLGLTASNEGTAALKEWPEILFASLPMWGLKKLLRSKLKLLIVRNFPFSKVKTGEFKSCLDEFFRFFIESRGQQLWPLKLKSSICSPLGFLLFGILIQILTWSSFKITSFQRRVSQGLKVFSFFEKSSPHLKEPKNARQQADQKTFLSYELNLDFAVSWPKIFSSGSDIAFLE